MIGVYAISHELCCLSKQGLKTVSECCDRYLIIPTSIVCKHLI